MKNKVLLLAVVFTVSLCASAQLEFKAPNGGGGFEAHMKPQDEISPKHRAAIIKKLQQNEVSLKKQGKLPAQNELSTTTLIWPLRQAKGFTDFGFYGISNYVDEDPLFPNKLLDYNCGKRTYDQTSGYNHAGTDIFTWPFFWQKMDRNAVEIIAGAAGTIIDKGDGEPDKSCAFCANCSWNAIYIRHADGSVAWYGHMKSGSLTTKGIGDAVAQGEYLGIVGSSGNSTGPHMHLELYKNSTYTELVDPWAGNCNKMNTDTSWWQNQQPYYVSTLNKVMTGSAAPQHSDCYGGEKTAEKVNFVTGDTVYVSSYYRDQLSGQGAKHTIYQPDNTVYTTWQQNFTTYYSSSWWWNYIILPTPAVAGTWRYEITYQNKKHSTSFAVNTAAIKVCPDNYTVLTSNLTGASYQWQLDAGAGFTNISDGVNYAGAAAKQLELKSIPSSFYGYQYRCLVNGNAGNTISLKFENNWNGNVSTAWEDARNWDCGIVPNAAVDVNVFGGLTNYPVVSTNAECHGTNIGANAQLTVLPGVKLQVKGN